MKKYLHLMRFSHWVKNLFVLAPLFFSGQFPVTEKMQAAFLAFLAMSFAASAVYILNDLADAGQDRLHPVKKFRPLASGAISAIQARIWIAIFAILALTTTLLLPSETLIWLSIYLLINVLYTFWAKHIPVIDIALIGIGFVLRVLLGGAATGIAVSHWLVMMTFVLALFLALGKRHDDLLLLEKNGQTLRRSLAGYNLKFTTQSMTLLAGTLFLLYFQYLEIAPTAAAFRGKMPYLSGILVLLAMLRYLQATFVAQKSGSPVAQLFSDHLLQFFVLCWLGHFMYMLYF